MGNGNSPPSQTVAKGTETFYCNKTFNSNDLLLTNYANNIQRNMAEWGVLRGRHNNTALEDDTYYDDCTITGHGYPCTYCGGHLCVLDNLTMPNCLNEIGFVDNF